jgi:hypothetical protein
MGNKKNAFSILSRMHDHDFGQWPRCRQTSLQRGKVKLDTARLLYYRLEISNYPCCHSALFFSIIE